MMNLVTGVFVDGAQRIAREEKNQDAPGSGRLRFRMFEGALRG